MANFGQILMVHGYGLPAGFDGYRGDVRGAGCACSGRQPGMGDYVSDLTASLSSDPYSPQPPSPLAPPKDESPWSGLILGLGLFAAAAWAFSGKR